MIPICVRCGNAREKIAYVLCDSCSDAWKKSGSPTGEDFWKWMRWKE